MIGHHELIRGELFRILNPKLQSEVNLNFSRLIINVRLARDFKIPANDGDFYIKGGLRSPLSWYISALRALREELGENVPATIISDGSSDELFDLLKEPCVERFVSHTAVQDLLAMCNAEHIIGTGGSSFTAWGGFLSQANIITIEGQSINWFKLQSSSSGRMRTFNMKKNSFGN